MTPKGALSDGEGPDPSRTPGYRGPQDAKNV